MRILKKGEEKEAEVRASEASCMQETDERVQRGRRCPERMGPWRPEQAVQSRLCQLLQRRPEDEA